MIKKKYYCIDCGKEITSRAKRCRSCSAKHFWNTNNYKFEQHKAMLESKLEDNKPKHPAPINMSHLINARKIANTKNKHTFTPKFKEDFELIKYIKCYCKNNKYIISVPEIYNYLISLNNEYYNLFITNRIIVNILFDLGYKPLKLYNQSIGMWNKQPSKLIYKLKKMFIKTLEKEFNINYKDANNLIRYYNKYNKELI